MCRSPEALALGSRRHFIPATGEEVAQDRAARFGIGLHADKDRAATEDHARQEAAYERLSYNRDASTIRRLLTETNVAATDLIAKAITWHFSTSL